MSVATDNKVEICISGTSIVARGHQGCILVAPIPFYPRHTPPRLPLRRPWLNAVAAISILPHRGDPETALVDAWSGFCAKRIINRISKSRCRVLGFSGRAGIQARHPRLFVSAGDCRGG